MPRGSRISTIAADRGAGIQPKRHKHRHDRLDDDVLADRDAVDDEAVFDLVTAEHHDRAPRRLARGGRGLEAEEFPEEHQRQESAAETHHRRPLEPLDRHRRAIGAGAERDQLADGRLGDREPVAFRGDD